MMRRSETIEECVLLVQDDGSLMGLYSDAVPWQAMGTVVAMPRASHVEFDLCRQEWVAHDLRTRTVIAAGPSRERVLAAERQYFLCALREGVFR